MMWEIYDCEIREVHECGYLVFQPKMTTESKWMFYKKRLVIYKTGYVRV